MPTRAQIEKSVFNREIKEENFFDATMIFWLGRLISRARGREYDETPRRIGTSVMHYAELKKETKKRLLKVRAEEVARRESGAFW